MMVLNGSDVTLTCSVQMNQNVLVSDLSLLVVNAQLISPDGIILNLSSPIIVGTTFTYTAQVNSFDDNDVGIYTCTATLTSQSTSTFLVGIDQLQSKPFEIKIIGK